MFFFFVCFFFARSSKTPRKKKKEKNSHHQVAAAPKMPMNALDPDTQAVLLENSMHCDIYEPRPNPDVFSTRTFSLVSTDKSLIAVRQRLVHAYVTIRCALEAPPYGNQLDRFLGKKLVGQSMFSSLSSICVPPLPSPSVVIVFVARVLSYASEGGAYLFEFPLERLVQLAATCGDLPTLRAMLDPDITKFHHGMAMSKDMRCRRFNPQMYDNPIEIAIIANTPAAVRMLVPHYLKNAVRTADLHVLADGPTLQHRAAELGRTECLQAMAEAGARLDDEEYHNRLPTSHQTPLLTAPGLSTPLAAALRAGHVDTARFLISTGSTVTWEAICSAVYGRDADGLALCFEHVSAEKANEWLHRGGVVDMSLVNRAIVEGSDACLRLLLERRPPLDLASHVDVIGFTHLVTPLCLAAALGHPALARTLLVAGASRIVPMAHGGFALQAGFHTPMTMAAQRGKSDVLEVLLDVQDSPYTSASDQYLDLFESFRVACRAGRQSCAELLLSRLDSTHQGVMAALPEDNVLEILLMLIRDVPGSQVQWFTARCGIAPLLCMPSHLLSGGQTAIHLATKRHGGHDHRMVEVLLGCLHPPCRIQLETFDDTGATALILCIKSDNIAGMRALLRFGADAEQADRDGVTPLMHATVCHSRAAVRVLLDAGARPERTDSRRRNALIHMCYSCWQPSLETSDQQQTMSQIAQTLLDQGGMDVNAQDEHGATARHVVAQLHIRDGGRLYRTLSAAPGVDLGVKDNLHRTADDIVKDIHGAVNGLLLGTGMASSSSSKASSKWPRPRGRPPHDSNGKAMAWDNVNGAWTLAPDASAMPDDLPTEPPKKRPRGRAPHDASGMPKHWNVHTGQWQ
ncbi:MAG: hypothetical protein CMM02_08180 [Rhodopirellula sp.]|nr:hypothetical protein [Rhodopirellula sp.]